MMSIVSCSPSATKAMSRTEQCIISSERNLSQARGFCVPQTSMFFSSTCSITPGSRIGILQTEGCCVLSRSIPLKRLAQRAWRQAGSSSGWASSVGRCAHGQVVVLALRSMTVNRQAR
jgi:hypothetical protein